MSQLPEEYKPIHPASHPRRVYFPGIEFPSDALSVKRLRTIFPNQFDTGTGNLTDGYSNLFFPVDHERPAQLVQLAEMISQERVLAEYAFYHAFESHTNQILDKECHECAAAARMELEPLYQHFKLADSPETARLLIRYVEEQGGHQGTRTANPARD